MSLAKALLSGTIISDPEKRFTPNNTAVTNFTLQVAAAGRDGAFPVRVTCWRNLADVVAEKLQKGQMITVEGRLQVHQFESTGGITRRSYEVDATNVHFGQLQPVLPPFDNSQNSSSNPSSGGGGGQQYNRGNANPIPPVAEQQHNGIPQQPVGVGAAPQHPSEGFMKDDFATEDDIPF